MPSHAVKVVCNVPTILVCCLVPSAVIQVTSDGVNLPVNIDRSLQIEPVAELSIIKVIPSLSLVYVSDCDLEVANTCISSVVV